MQSHVPQSSDRLLKWSPIGSRTYSMVQHGIRSAIMLNWVKLSVIRAVWLKIAIWSNLIFDTVMDSANGDEWEVVQAISVKDSIRSAIKLSWGSDDGVRLRTAIWSSLILDIKKNSNVLRQWSPMGSRAYNMVQYSIRWAMKCDTRSVVENRDMVQSHIRHPNGLRKMESNGMSELQYGWG
jgi:hypothetical protein